MMALRHKVATKRKRRWLSTDRTLIVLGFILQLLLTTYVQYRFKNAADEKFAVFNQSLSAELEEKKSEIASHAVVAQRRLDAEGELYYLEQQQSRSDDIPQASVDSAWLQRTEIWLTDRRAELTAFEKKFSGVLPLSVRSQIGYAKSCLDGELATIEARATNQVNYSDQVLIDGIMADHNHLVTSLDKADTILLRLNGTALGEDHDMDFWDVTGGVDSTAPAW